VKRPVVPPDGRLNVPDFLHEIRSGTPIRDCDRPKRADGLVVKTIVEIRFLSWNYGCIKEKRLKTENQITKNLGTKTQPDSVLRPSGDDHRRTRNSRELCETSSSGARTRPAIIG
jgi:hypothetical protein